MITPSKNRIRAGQSSAIRRFVRAEKGRLKFTWPIVFDIELNQAGGDEIRGSRRMLQENSHQRFIIDRIKIPIDLVS